MASHRHIATPQQGLTIVEVVVTISILSIFLFGFIQAFIVLEYQRISVYRHAKASDIAYSRLREYNARPADPSSPGELLKCSTSELLLKTTSLTDAGLGGGARVTVVASAPFGCSGADFGQGVIKIEATVFHSNDEEVKHATYVKQ